MKCGFHCITFERLLEKDGKSFQLPSRIQHKNQQKTDSSYVSAEITRVFQFKILFSAQTPTLTEH